MKRTRQRQRDHGAITTPTMRSSAPRTDLPKIPPALTPGSLKDPPMDPQNSGAKSIGNADGFQEDSQKLQELAIEQRYHGLRNQIQAFNNPKIRVIVPYGSNPHLEETFQSYLSAGATSKVYRRQKGANGEMLTEIPPPQPPGHWTASSLKTRFELGGVLVRFRGAEREAAVRAIARFEVLTNMWLTATNPTPGKPRVRVLVSESDQSAGPSTHQQPHSSDATGMNCRFQQSHEAPEELSPDEWRCIQLLAAKLQMDEQVLAGFPRETLRLLIGGHNRQAPIGSKDPAPEETPGPLPVSSVTEGLDSWKSKGEGWKITDPLKHENTLPLDSNEGQGQPATAPVMPRLSAATEDAGIDDNVVPDGYPWVSFLEESEDRQRYQQLQRLGKESRTPDDEARLRQFRARCRQKASLAAKIERQASPFLREAMLSKVSTWRSLLESPLQIKEEATDRRIDEVRSSRRRAGRDLSAIEETKARRVMDACQKAMEEYAINSVRRLDKLRSMKLPKSLTFPSPTPTRKGHLLLHGEPPETTLMVHDHLHRSGITRPMLDFEFSAPDGFAMDPKWAQYIAVRLATRLGVDPRRVIAATHDPDKQKSKRRPGNPVKAHAHVAIPVAFPDGSYLHVPHLPAIIQAELAAINAEIGLSQHVAIAMRGRYAAAMRSGADHLYVEKRYDPTRFKEETRKKYKMDHRGVVRLPLTKFDREVAAIPFPAIANITCPAGVAHVNTMSQKRRSAAAGDQRRYNATLRELIDIRRRCRASEQALRDLEACLPAQLALIHPVESAVSGLNRYITGESQAITRTHHEATNLLRADLIALKQHRNNAEAIALRLRVELQQILCNHRYIKE